MIGIAVVLCAGYWLVMTQVPNPAGVTGDLTPGRELGRLHRSRRLWRAPVGQLEDVGSGRAARDHTGDRHGAARQSRRLWLRTDGAPGRKAALLAGAGLAGIAIGCAWHPFFPINKALWSSSFVFFTAGAAALLLALLYRDRLGRSGWRIPS